MTELPLTDILDRATKLHDSKADWHFHLLTPLCILNTTSQYALVLEDIGAGESYVYYAAIKPFAASKQLAKMLHSQQTLDLTGRIKPAELADAEKPIYHHAQQLTDHQRPWHHHLLFPSCTFNEQAPQWLLVFEDQSTDDVTRYTTEAEPTLLLTGLEQLFYRR